jgi:glyoxylase I family protein
MNIKEDAMAGVKTTGVHHIRITVTDPAKTAAFYTDLLGFNVMMEFPDGPLVTNGTVFLGLRKGPDDSRAVPGDRFDPNKVGLDHLSLLVGSRADLDTLAQLCKAQGVPCGEVVDFGDQFRFYVLMLEDPDGIQAELTALYD